MDIASPGIIPLWYWVLLSLESCFLLSVLVTIVFVGWIAIWEYELEQRAEDISLGYACIKGEGRRALSGL